MTAGRANVHGAVIRGVEAIPVSVEVCVSSGLPGFFVVGMADVAVQESRERVKAALRASGFAMPGDRIVVSLAPSSLKKSGSGLDLPIAMGLLAASGQIPADAPFLTNSLFVGELSLAGKVRPVSGLLAYALCALDCGLDLVCACVPEQLVPIEGLRQFGIKRLHDVGTGEVCAMEAKRPRSKDVVLDYADVSGNEVAKRVCQIAAAGRHGLLMMGPPGSGKTMLASRIPSILPPLSENEALRVALIHSVAGLDISSILAGKRPFIAPHHSATSPGLIGGGSPVRPGALSLAHRGVAFLDEIAEFKPSVLQQIRQPMESGRITITRADGSYVFPAEFMLVAAANPCPCGYFGDEAHTCSCSLAQVRAYQARIGGPLMDRIDLHVDVGRVDPSAVMKGASGVDSQSMREGVMAAWEYASWRTAHYGEAQSPSDIVSSCKLRAEDESYFEKVARANNMSGRAVVRTFGVARTIADMAQRERANRDDLLEALAYRVREGVGAV